MRTEAEDAEACPTCEHASFCSDSREQAVAVVVVNFLTSVPGTHPCAQAQAWCASGLAGYGRDGSDEPGGEGIGPGRAEIGEGPRKESGEVPPWADSEDSLRGATSRTGYSIAGVYLHY